MEGKFLYDVFLSYSSKDKEIVHAIADRLTGDGLKLWLYDWIIKPGDNIPAKIEEGLAQSRVLVLCMSANAFGPDWTKLESDTFRFRDPLNKERRFLPLRLDDAPIKGSLAQFLYIDWLQTDNEQAYAKLLETCLPTVKSTEAESGGKEVAEDVIQLDIKSIDVYAFSSDGKRVLISTEKDNNLSLWDVNQRRCLKVIKGHKSHIRSIKWSADQLLAVSCTGALSGKNVENSVRLWDLTTGDCLRVFNGHTGIVYEALLSNDNSRILSCSEDKTVRLWNADTGKCLRVFKGHEENVYCISWSPDQRYAVSGSYDQTMRLWHIESGQCLKVFQGHKGIVFRIAMSAENTFALSASDDQTVRLWDTASGKCLHVFEGHSDFIGEITWCADQRHFLSGSHDNTVRLWDAKTGLCLRVFEGHLDRIVGLMASANGRFAYSGEPSGSIRRWNLAEFISEERDGNIDLSALPLSPDQIQYTNAKVLIVGDTNAGKTGLTHRLATGKWKPSEDSTVGAWSTQLSLKDPRAEQGVDREIWLWDFGGQADQRLIHQLYMDHTALILQLFNADQEDVLPGLRDWQTALRRCVKEKIPHFLVAGRIDTGFKASREKLQTFAKEQELAYYETSAKEGTGCNDLRAAMFDGIPWAQLEKRTSPRIFKLIKDEILKLRDKGEVLLTFKELREELWRRLPGESHFTDETLQTVIGLLDGPGVVKELAYGTYILLAPEWINAYAQAVIRTLRSAENDLGVLPLRSISEGKLIYQSIGRDGIPTEMKRLPQIEERVVLGEMERQLEQRGLCLRQGDKLVFPSHCGRDRPEVLKHPSVFVSYVVKGFLDDIYATLVVKLADSQSFTLKELWRDAADFVTLTGDHHMGIKLTRKSGSEGDINVYFGKGVTEEAQVIFANYIHGHLEVACEEALRLRHYVCPKCHTPKGNPEVLMKKLLTKKQEADTECDDCGARFKLWDTLERKFASEVVRKQVEELQADDLAKLTTRRKGKLLVLDVGARITSANQKWIEIPGDEDDGIDIMLEFTNEDGNGVGKGLCLQLKAGNSFLKTRKSDGAEIFTIKKQRWVQTWMNQVYPVMLVIGTFSAEDERSAGKQKLEFADVRWMEISDVLRRESENGTKPVKQIEFKGERLDMTSVRKWREKILNKK